MQIRPTLTRYLGKFDKIFGRVTTRRHLYTYIEGQLGDLERKSVEPIADAAGTPPRTLQKFLILFRWDESRVRDRLQQRVARRHAHPHSVGIIDETTFVKKGDKTACVQRQHCGAIGKMENCVVSVHQGYATLEFHAMLDGDLFLPEQTWDANRHRCRAAGISNDVRYRPKWQIALEQLCGALANGVRFRWLTIGQSHLAGLMLRNICEVGPDRLSGCSLRSAFTNVHMDHSSLSWTGEKEPVNRPMVMGPWR